MSHEPKASRQGPSHAFTAAGFGLLLGCRRTTTVPAFAVRTWRKRLGDRRSDLSDQAREVLGADAVAWLDLHATGQWRLVERRMLLGNGRSVAHDRVLEFADLDHCAAFADAHQQTILRLHVDDLEKRLQAGAACLTRQVERGDFDAAACSTLKSWRRRMRLLHERLLSLSANVAAVDALRRELDEPSKPEWDWLRRGPADDWSGATGARQTTPDDASGKAVDLSRLPRGSWMAHVRAALADHPIRQSRQPRDEPLRC